MKKIFIVSGLLLLFGAFGVVFAGGEQEPGASPRELFPSKDTSSDDKGDSFQEPFWVEREHETRDTDTGRTDRTAGTDRTLRAERTEEQVPAAPAKKEPAAKEPAAEKPAAAAGDTKAPAKPAASPAPAAVSATAEGIQQNFEPSGVSLGGNVSAGFNAGNLDDDTSLKYLTLGVRPNFGLMVSSGFALLFTPSFYIATSMYDLDTINSSTVNFGLSVGIINYFYSGNPLVPALGANLGLYYYPNTDYQFSFLSLAVGADFLFYYFINDRTAPYVGLSPDLTLWLDQNYIGLNVGLVLGFSYFLPGKPYALD